jgi:hypothetical protein
MMRAETARRLTWIGAAVFLIFSPLGLLALRAAQFVLSLTGVSP